MNASNTLTKWERGTGGTYSFETSAGVSGTVAQSDEDKLWRMELDYGFDHAWEAQKRLKDLKGGIVRSYIIDGWVYA
tara:strand:- start:227 stop:457 length:231 start_codon:yes stop_codon:yes gene_type:complete